MREMDNSRISLDNPVFNGQLRDFTYKRRSVMPVRPRVVNDISPPKPETISRPEAKELPHKQVEPQVPVNTEYPSAELKKFDAPEIDTTVAPRPYFKKKRSKTPVVLTLMAVLLFVLGGAVAFMGFKTNHKAAAEVKKMSASSSSVNVSETKPNSATFNSYSVDPWQPRFLMIPKFSVQALVRQVGADSKGQLQAPYNIHEAGWYKYSAEPGDSGGAMLVDGHVSGPTQQGVFYDLKNLIEGDDIQIQRGDGHIFTFRVVKSQTYQADKVDMSAAMVSADSSKLGLNLITCSGKLDSKTDQFSQRTVVFAVSY